MTELPQRMCIKAAFLRLRGYDNLREFEASDSNIRLTRRGRIFIKEKTGKMNPYCYPASRFCNPYSLTDHTLKESLEKFRVYLNAMLEENPEAAKEFEALRSKKYLGCFCEPSQSCHVDVVIERMQSRGKKRKLD
jgi:hypothetical protein